MSNSGDQAAVSRIAHHCFGAPHDVLAVEGNPSPTHLAAHEVRAKATRSIISPSRR